MMPGEIFRSLARSPHDSVSHHTTIPHYALKCVFLSLPFSCCVCDHNCSLQYIQVIDDRIELL